MKNKKYSISKMSTESQTIMKGIFNLKLGENKVFPGRFREEILRVVRGLSFYKVSLKFGLIVVTYIEPDYYKSELDPNDPFETTFLEGYDE